MLFISPRRTHHRIRCIAKIDSNDLQIGDSNVNVLKTKNLQTLEKTHGREAKKTNMKRTRLSKIPVILI